MLQASTTDNKQSGAHRPDLAEDQGEELHQRTTFSASLQAGLGAPHEPRHGQFAHLHRTYGNQAVLRALSHSAPAAQTKLEVNQPGDEYEQEADRVADQVMRMASPPAVQKRCSACEQENQLQRKCAHCE